MTKTSDFMEKNMLAENGRPSVWRRVRGWLKKPGNAALALTAVLLAGIFARSAVIWGINRLYPAEEIHRLGSMGLSLGKTRLFWRALSDKIIGAGAGIFILGNLVLCAGFLRKGRPVSFLRLAARFLLTSAAMFACVLPFALTEREAGFFWEYFFPLWSILIETAILFLAASAGNLWKGRKK